MSFILLQGSGHEFKSTLFIRLETGCCLWAELRVKSGMNKIPWGLAGLSFILGSVVGYIQIAHAKCGEPSLSADLVMVDDPGQVVGPDDGQLRAIDDGDSFTIAIWLDRSEDDFDLLVIGSSRNLEPE